MKLLEFVRLLRKHIILVMLVPLVMASLAAWFTRDRDFSYTSQTVLYTGLATGSSVEMDKTFNYFVTNTAFDNLINIINSRETQEEVAIRLLSQHLLLGHPDPKYISSKSFEELQQITPAYIYSFLSRGKGAGVLSDSSVLVQDSTDMFPASITRSDYESTVRNLTLLMKSNDSNFVYKLLNFTNPHYSIEAISHVKAARINNSDLIRLTYEVDDPGICQQTLAIFNEVCIRNYKHIKENRSDEVVKYFEEQLREANGKLVSAEDKLLSFNRSNNIINYYEQSKAVAVVKEDMEVDYNNKRAQLAGLDAAIKRLEEKLSIQDLVQTRSGAILEKKKQLSDLNYAMATAEADGVSEKDPKVQAMVKQADALKNEIRKSVGDLYSYQNTVTGLPVSKVLDQWISNMIEAENLRAKLMVMEQRNKDFQRQYAEYAPAGANIKRIEREISVSEQGYLELLHGLNLAKLKLQDNEMSSNLKAVDAPYFPLTPIPTKRKAIVAATGLLGLLLTLGVILGLEYTDGSLRNQKRAQQVMGVHAVGMLPKVLLHPNTSDFSFVLTRALEMIIQKVQQALALHAGNAKPAVIVIASNETEEGKSIVAGNLCRKWKEQGKSVLFLRPEGDEGHTQYRKQSYPLTRRLLGYADARIDRQHDFLKDPATYLDESSLARFATGPHFFRTTHVAELFAEPRDLADYDYVLVEVPALLVHNYPAELMAKADMCLFISRANRAWSVADQTLLNGLQQLAGDKLHSVLNGVEVQEMESLLGELPKRRSVLRRKIKSLLRFNFFSKQQF